MTIWFISDIHLSDSRPTMTRRLFDLLQRAPRQRVTAIYFLGDIFEYWVGQDILPTFFAPLQELTHELHQKGIKQYFLPGNRDFLLEKSAAESLHWVLLPDCALIEHQYRRFLLMHGDLLCEQDTGYQHYRRVSHQPWIKKLFLSLPRTWRLKIVQKLQNASRRSHDKSHTHTQKTWISRATALHYLNLYQADVLIHGHVHYPAMHTYEHHAKTYRHIILKDWSDAEGYYVSLGDHAQILGHTV